MAREGVTHIRECCSAGTLNMCWGAPREQMHPQGKASDGCLDKDAAQEPMATLPPASLLFILIPEEPGAWAGGSSSEAGRAVSKTGQSWTSLLHYREHLFTHARA